MLIKITTLDMIDNQFEQTGALKKIKRFLNSKACKHVTVGTKYEGIFGV